MDYLESSRQMSSVIADPNVPQELTGAAAQVTAAFALIAIAERLDKLIEILGSKYTDDGDHNPF